MILKVLNEKNEVLHDCREVGCDISWDGIALRDLSVAELYLDAGTRPSTALPVAIGKPVPNAGNPDASLYDVKGTTAKIRGADKV